MRSFRFLLLAVAFGLAAVSDIAAQQGCGTCWNASNGVSSQHIFSSSTPTPPFGYTLGSHPERRLESDPPELPQYQGHTFWLAGTCEGLHAACDPIEFEDLVRNGTTEAVTEWIMNAPNVRAAESVSQVWVQCDGALSMREVPFGVWVAVRTGQLAQELGTPAQ